MVTKTKTLTITKEYDLVFDIVVETINVCKGKNYKLSVEGSDEDPVFKFTSKSKTIGSMSSTTENDKTTLKVTGASLQKIVESLDKEIQKKLKDPVSVKDVESSIFSSYELFVKYYPELVNNKPLFKKISARLKSSGLEKIELRNTASEVELSTLFSPEIAATWGRVFPHKGNATNSKKNDVKKWLEETYSKQLPDLEMFNEPDTDKSTAIKIGNRHIGAYYQDRNALFFYFDFIKTSQYTTFSNDVGKLIEDVATAIENVKIKKIDAEEMFFKIITETLTKGTKQKIMDEEQRLKDRERAVRDYTNKIQDTISLLREGEQHINTLKAIADGDSTLLKDELIKAKKLPFVKSIDVEEGKLAIEVNPIFLKLKNFKRNLSAAGSQTLYTYLEGTKFLISGQYISVANINPQITRPHPHVSGNSPCFGGGEGSRKIFEMKESLKLSDLSKMLWYWLSVYQDGAAYIAQPSWVNYCAEVGIPIFKEDGTRVEYDSDAKTKKGVIGDITPNKESIKVLKAKYKDVKFKK